MEESRRLFLKIAGLGTLGLGGVPALKALARSKVVQRDKRLAMVIDVRRCLQKEGCRVCIEACHHTHNVPNVSAPEYHLPPDLIRRREVKWIWKETFEHAFVSEENRYTTDALKDKDVLVFCNHCDNPSCVRVCPTKATWKRVEDGVVMMDMHRCIGCRYCVVACPYGSRSFNWVNPRDYLKESAMNPSYPTRMKGVVEKCNFCDERLDQGLPPACVAACPQRAMTFGNLEDESSDVRRILRARFTIRRKPGLGTDPQIYYVV